MRSQRGECCISAKLGAAARRENQPFVEGAAGIRGRIHTLRTLLPFFEIGSTTAIG